MSKIIKTGKQAQEAILNGAEKLCLPVAATLGPLGSNVMLDKGYGAPDVNHDGVTVAKYIDLEDPFENMVAQAIKDAASKTNDSSGDGTTTSTILAYEIIKKGQALGNPMKLRTKIQKEANDLVEALKKHSIPVKDIAHVARISAQDKEIGDLIAQAFNKVGKDGVVSVEEGKGTNITVEYKEGMEYDNGYASSYFVTNKEKKEAEIAEAYILVTDYKLSRMEELMPFLESFVKKAKNLVVVADDIEGEALTMFVVNHLKHTFNLLAVKAPAFGDARKEMLQDIAILTGATFISADTGRKIDSITVNDLGRVEKVWANKENTKIIGGKGEEKVIKARIDEIKSLLKNTTDSNEKEILQGRLAKLSTGVAVINIGAGTEMEFREKKERVKDAVAATRAALQEGVIPGGATMLMLLCKGEFLKDIVKRPFEVLMENSELNEKPESIDQIGFGIDVMDGKYKNLIEAGIVDATKVVREALQNAVGVATSILTTKVLITDKKEE